MTNVQQGSKPKATLPESEPRNKLQSLQNPQAKPLAAVMMNPIGMNLTTGSGMTLKTQRKNPPTQKSR